NRLPALLWSALLAVAGCGDEGGFSFGNYDFKRLPDMGPVSHAYPQSSNGGTPEDGLAQLNDYRMLIGLDPVRGDNGPTYSCEGHLDYLAWEAQQKGVPCYLEHSESDHLNPYYSPANEMAGLNSVLACGGGGNYPLANAVDGWINTLYHRLPLIDNG